MTIAIPERLQYLLKWETKAMAFLALALADGSPQVTPVWFDWDGTHIIVNTARGRVKDKALHRKAKATILIIDSNDWEDNYLMLTGTVALETEEGAYDQICRLNEKYHGTHRFALPPGQVRVTYKILPEQGYPKK